MVGLLANFFPTYFVLSAYSSIKRTVATTVNAVVENMTITLSGHGFGKHDMDTLKTKAF